MRTARINMPVMNGFELLAAAKTDDTIKHIPILMLTSSPTSAYGCRLRGKEGDSYY